jgi:hypothetical protein
VGGFRVKHENHPQKEKKEAAEIILLVSLDDFIM